MSNLLFPKKRREKPIYREGENGRERYCFECEEFKELKYYYPDTRDGMSGTKPVCISCMSVNRKKKSA